MNNKLIPFVLVLASLSLGACAQIPLPFWHKCPCENCWEQCFNNPPHPSFADEYAQLYQLFSRIQSDRVLTGAQSSALLIDLSIPAPLSFFQKNLAKLAAFALNSGRKCHPTVIGGHFPWGSFVWFPLNVNCPTACQIVDEIDFLPANIPFGPPNLLDVTCLLAKIGMDADPFQCNFAKKRYAIAFTNELQLGSSYYSLFPVRLEVVTSTTPTSTFAPTFTTEAGGSVSFLYTNSMLTASNYLMSCIRKKCCFQKPWEAIEFAESKSDEEEKLDDLTEGIIYYVDAKDSKNVKKTEGNLQEFLAEKEKEVDPCVVIPSEDGETGEGCMGELCEDPAYVEQCPKNCEKCRRG